jgi:hypothetical protein
MDMGHWFFDKQFNSDEWFGFLYRITELDTQREYIGKKQFKKMQRKKIVGRKNRKTIYSDSNWRAYTGSSVELNEQIKLKGKDNYRFEIISLHETKGSLYYAEVYSQIVEDVLRSKLDNGDRKFYNKMINSVKFLPPSPSILEEEMKMLKK